MNAITSEKSTLGFVGIGYMGRPIAQRLLESGFKVAAYDRHRAKAEELIRYGGTVAESVAVLSSSCDVVLSASASLQRKSRSNCMETTPRSWIATGAAVEYSRPSAF
jgi:phosphoglycerate dehydrogenase-like enzyme